MTHKPNLIVSYQIITPHVLIENVEEYVDSLTPNVYDGYDCMNAFMSDVVQEKDRFIQNTKIMMK